MWLNISEYIYHCYPTKEGYKGQFAKRRLCERVDISGLFVRGKGLEGLSRKYSTDYPRQVGD